MKKKHYILLSIFVVLVSILSYGWCEYNRPPINVVDVEAELEFDADDLINLFTSNSLEESKGLANRVTQISGEITNILFKESTIVINGAIRCEMNQSLSEILVKKNISMSIGDAIKIKGIFGGYDDLMEEILFVRCNF